MNQAKPLSIVFMLLLSAVLMFGCVGDGSEVDDDETAGAESVSPVADAGPDQTASAPATVTLDGSASSDADGDSPTFQWELILAPDLSTATLSDPTAVNPTFVVDVAGTYVALLIVNDGTTNSLPDTVTISTRNSAPVANAGPIRRPLPLPR
jgi:hypothetical protein